MKGTLAKVWRILASPALTPVVIGFFLLLYIGIAFFTDETLTTLIVLTSRSLLLAAVLALLPLNSACRMLDEGHRWLQQRRALRRAGAPLDPALYDETVELASAPGLGGLEERLKAQGYRTRESGSQVAAWRGLSLAPARLLFLAGTFCLFGGILVSLTSRAVIRQSVIEGVPFPSPSGMGGIVERIVLQPSPGPILAKDLLMQVAGSAEGGARSLGVYPPSLYAGSFVYPRYLGVALDYRLWAPELPGGYQKHGVYPLYPPGKEAAAEIPGSPYRISFSLDRPEDGSDPYVTGRMVFLFKLSKGSDVIASGSVPQGGEFVRDGIRVGFPEARRMVITDFVRDYGVLMIWSAFCLLLLALLAWLPVRLFLPRREMLFRCDGESVRACSHAEGRGRRHAGVFHEVLDVLAAGHPVGRPAAAE